MKSLCLSTWAGQKIKEKYQNGFLMCIYGVHICICIPNIKFLCLILCQWEVCTDNTDTNDNDANDDEQCMIVLGSLVDKSNESKNTN